MVKLIVLLAMILLISGCISPALIFMPYSCEMDGNEYVCYSDVSATCYDMATMEQWVGQQHHAPGTLPNVQRMTMTAILYEDAGTRTFSDFKVEKQLGLVSVKNLNYNGFNVYQSASGTDLWNNMQISSTTQGIPSCSSYAYPHTNNARADFHLIGRYQVCGDEQQLVYENGQYGCVDAYVEPEPGSGILDIIISGFGVIYRYIMSIISGVFGI